MKDKQNIIIALLVVLIGLLTFLVFTPHTKQAAEEYVQSEIPNIVIPESKGSAEKKNPDEISGEAIAELKVDEAVEKKEEPKVEKIKKEEPKVEEVKELKGKISLEGYQTDEGVKLNWSVDGVNTDKGFKVLRSIGANPIFPADKNEYVGSGKERSFHWNTLADKLYYFRVCTYNGSGCSTYSNTIAVKAPKGSDKQDKSDNGSYASSITLEGYKKGDDQVKLEWSLSGGGAPQGYKVVMDDKKDPKYPDDSPQYIGDGNKRSHSYYSKDFDDDESYYFRVCLYTGDGCKNYSNNVKVGF